MIEWTSQQCQCCANPRKALARLRASKSCPPGTNLIPDVAVLVSSSKEGSIMATTESSSRPQFTFIPCKALACKTIDVVMSENENDLLLDGQLMIFFKTQSGQSSLKANQFENLKLTWCDMLWEVKEEDNVSTMWRATGGKMSISDTRGACVAGVQSRRVP